MGETRKIYKIVVGGDQFGGKDIDGNVLLKWIL
jgi:hypothetical protein